MDPSAVLVARLTPVERTRDLERTVVPYLRRFDETRDERAIFTFLYLRVTQDLGLHLAKAGFFEDPDWVATLAERFAAHFFAAMDGIDRCLDAARREHRRPRPDELRACVPQPWVDAYVAIRDRPFVLESLLFCMAPHLTYDLVLSLLEAGMEDAGRSHVADFHRMNTVLASQVPALEKEIAARYNPWLGIIDKLAGSYDRFFSNYGIRMTRAVAWYNALRLVDPASKQDTQRAIATTTNAFIEEVRRPRLRWIRVLVRIARFVLPRVHRWPSQSEPINR